MCDDDYSRSGKRKKKNQAKDDPFTSIDCCFFFQMDSKSIEKKTALRQLMKQEKQKRIDSPLAKFVDRFDKTKSRQNPIEFRYTNTGELFCALCNQQISSETFWKGHVNGREHKQVH